MKWILFFLCALLIATPAFATSSEDVGDPSEGGFGADVDVDIDDWDADDGRDVDEGDEYDGEDDNAGQQGPPAILSFTGCSELYYVSQNQYYHCLAEWFDDNVSGE